MSMQLQKKKDDSTGFYLNNSAKQAENMPDTMRAVPTVFEIIKTSINVSQAYFEKSVLLTFLNFHGP